MSTLNKNELFANRYLLKDRIGKGSFGEVWLASDQDTEIEVAIKIYISVDEQGMEDFKNEFKLSFSLNHSGLLHAYHFSIFDNRPFLVMPYCERGSLSSCIGRIKDEKEIWKIIRDVASGLAYLHERDIIHQDIKPGNILIGENNYMITDFGESTVIKNTLLRNSTRSHTEKGGSIPYMSPERFAQDHAVIKASDIWSLGVTIFEIAEGKLPFEGNGGLLQLHGAEIPKLSSCWSKEMNDTFRKCVSPQTWDRPSAKELVTLAEKQLVEKHIKKESKPAKPVTITDRRMIKSLIVAIIGLLGIIWIANQSFSFEWFKRQEKQEYYEGDLVNGKRHGWGKLDLGNSVIHEGNFRYDKCTGWGKRTYADGSYYLGQWKAGEREGIGTFYDVSGKVMCGIWENDSLPARFEVPDQERTVYGIDISRYQQTIDWGNLALPYIGSSLYVDGGLIPMEQERYSPIQFAIIKAPEGSDVVDPMFVSNFNNALKHNVTRGAYHILSCYPDIEDQVGFFRKNVQLKAGDLPPVLDIEPTHIKNWTKKEVRQNALAWLETIESIYGVKPILYTNERLYTDYLSGEEFKEYHLWIANLKQRPATEWLIWQFDHHASIKGLQSGTEIDLNIFNGSLEDFRQFVQMYGIKENSGEQNIL